MKLLLRIFLMFSLFCGGFHHSALSQKRITIPEYINMYKDDAILDMQKMGVPASITLAQGILESESGNSDLAKEARNHFGIKCHNDWSGPTFHKDDDEVNECFRKYSDVLESFDDHSKFLRERPRYSFLFDYEITDYKNWAHGLKKAGYATNPRYAELLINLIDEYDLHQYDSGGRKMPVAIQEKPIANNKPQPQPKVNKPKHTYSKPAAGQFATNQNGVPYVIAKSGDSWFSIATQFDLRLWQILKYNDAEKTDHISEGDFVYLKPKRGRPQTDFHVVETGETLRDISQSYGVKLKKLYKRNHLEAGASVQPGQKIILW